MKKKSQIQKWKEKTDKITDLITGTFFIEHEPGFPCNQYIKSLFFIDFSFLSKFEEQSIVGLNKRLEYERIIPFGCVDIIIQSKPSFMITALKSGNEMLLPKVFMSPMATKHLTLRRFNEAKVFGIRLWPWTNGLLTDSCMAKHLNCLLNSDHLLMKIENLEKDGLFELPVKEAFEKIENIFLDFISAFQNNNIELIANAAKFIIEHRGVQNMDSFFCRYPLSQRRIEQIFNTMIGVCPKYYSRIIKFQNIFNVINRENVAKYTDLVYECGYFDQAHFIRNFKEFTGTTPRQFFKENNIISTLMMGKNSISSILNFSKN